MEFSTALSIYAANIDNTALTTVLRTRMRDYYNSIKDFERKKVKSPNLWFDEDEMRLQNTRNGFIGMMGAAQEIVAKLTLPVEKTPAKMWDDMKNLVVVKTAVFPGVAVLDPLGVLPMSQPVTSTIPPSVAREDAGYLPPVSLADVQSKTDISGKSVEQISDVFITRPEVGKTFEEIEEAKFFPKVPTPPNLILVLAGVGIIFFLIASG